MSPVDSQKSPPMLAEGGRCRRDRGARGMLAEEPTYKLKCENNWEALSPLDWMRRSEQGQEAEADTVQFLGGETAKAADEVGEEHFPKGHTKLRCACATRHHSLLCSFNKYILSA